MAFDTWPPLAAGDEGAGLVVCGGSVKDAKPALGRLRPLLSEGELARAARFKFDRDRVAYVVAHGMLRQVLASRMDVEPDALRFSHREDGKPVLDRPCSDVCFSLSHAGDAIVVAFGNGFEVGVDAEAVSRNVEHERLAERYFSSSEAAVIRGRAPDQQLEAFFSCWTRKEAIMKAAGKGLSIELNSFNVDIDVHVEVVATHHGRWFVRDLALGNGYAGAVASARDAAITRWRWYPPT